MVVSHDGIIRLPNVCHAISLQLEIYLASLRLFNGDPDFSDELQALAWAETLGKAGAWCILAFFH